MGELRGLAHLGLLDQVSTLSTVSGGTWAGVTFAYLPSVISDDDVLGGVVPDPRDLTWMHESGQDPARALDVLDDHALGSLCTRIGLVEFLAKAVELFAEYRDSPHVLWTRAVGALALEPFGLGDTTARGVPARYFSDARTWVDTAILPLNPALSALDFQLVQKPGRTHLVTSSTLFYPAGVHLRRPAPGSPALEPYPLEASPTEVGVPIPFERGIGGGFVDPFAFGGRAPAAAPQRDRVSVATPAPRFALSDITGASSSAFVGPPLDTFGAAHPWIEDIDLYKSFPNYDTVRELRLEPRQVNLLAHLSCWNVINAPSIGGFPSNVELIMEIFGQTAGR